MGDIINFGPERPGRPARWRILVGLAALAGVLLASLVVFALPTDPPQPMASRPAVSPSTGPAAGPSGPSARAEPACVPVGWKQSPVPTASIAGLVIDRPGTGSSLDRCDRTAAEGPWTVVVRGPGGSLGRRSAVITFPADAPTNGRQVAVGRVRGSAGDGVITWPAARSHARIRGDLSEADLLAIAARTRVVDGRPSVDPPTGFTVLASGPYRPPTVHQLRYGAADLGEQDALGAGLVYSGVSGSGGFEDQLHAVANQDGPPVHGRPTVVSPVFGGNATLAWEPAPGLVAYVGYSGANLDAAAVAALHRLAGRSQLLTSAQWQATGPYTVDQTNQPG